MARETLEADPIDWLAYYLRPYITDSQNRPVGFAAHQQQFWKWAWQVRRGHAPTIGGLVRDGIIGIWPRGGGKSSTIEMFVTSVAARRARRYVLYVCSTQPQADDHVENIADMMTSERLAEDYPTLADRAVDKYGPKAWRRNRVQSAIGCTVDALGLDASMRGAKLGRDRPDLIVLDDIDDINDSAFATGNKVRTITRSLLPAGSSEDTVTIGVQNLVLRGGIFDRIAHGQAGFLQHALVLGPTPALLDCEVEAVDGKWKITRGVPTWPEGQSLATCQRFVDRFGKEAFLAECQHEVQLTSGLVHGQFSPMVHRWQDDVAPRFIAVYGGLDFGSEGEGANHSAGLVAGELEDHRLLLLAEFKERGADVAVRQVRWIREQENRWRGPGSIQWAGDGTEHLGLQLLRQYNIAVQPSRMGGHGEAAREARVRAVGRRLAIGPQGKPGLYFKGELTETVKEFEGYKREQPKFEGDRTQPKIIKVNDHLMTALEYLVEMVDGGPLSAHDREANEPAYTGIIW